VTVRGYQLAISWSRGGDYSGTLEDVSPYVPKQPDLVATWGRSEPRATSDAAGGKLTFSLLNHGRQFSPENTSSPIAGHVLTGTPVRLNVLSPDGTTVTVYQAPIDTLQVEDDPVNRMFNVECGDGWGKPGDTKLSTPVYQGQRTGDLVGIILDAIGWPAASRSIDSGATLVPYWWAEGIDAQTAVTDLVHSEGPPAAAWVQNGIFYFRDRHHRATRDASLTSQATYTHKVPSGAVGTDNKILRGSFTYDHGLDHIVNSATIEVAPWLPGSESVVWSTDDPISIGASQSVVLVIRADNPFLNLQVPSAAVTYLDDGGVLTSDYHVASGSVSFTLSRTSGQSALVTITAGGSGAFLDTGLKVRGTPVEQGAARQFSASDAQSQAIYGDNDWDGTAPWAHFGDAEAIVDQIVAIYARPMPSVTFDVDGVLSSGTLTRILDTQVSDRITVTNDELGLSADFIVEQVTHTIRQLGVRYIQTIGAQIAEPVQAVNPFTFGVAASGFGLGQFALDAGNNPTTMFRFDTAGKGFGQGVFAT
jgi:hypothetical protein